VASGKRLIQLRAREIVVASGSYEYPTSFENNDLTGIMLGSGVLRLMHLYGVKPGRRAVVVSADEGGLALAVDLRRAGVEVAAVIDERSAAGQSQSAAELKRLGIPHQVSSFPVSAQGRGRVKSLQVASLNSQGLPDPRQVTTYACDLVCLCSNRAPSLEILLQNRGTVRFDPILDQMVPDSVPPHFRVAGHLTGIRDLSAIVGQGRVAGLEAAGAVRALEPLHRAELERLKAQRESAEQRYRETRKPRALCSVSSRGKQFACLCEDVTQKDIGHAIAEGFDEMELLKRYTTAAMGPCQGRMCLMPVALSCAAETRRTLAETGTTTSRPPILPVSLGVLAGPHHEPTKLTPMHHRHVQAGARQMDMGEWKRPHSYTKPELEWEAVRERVGLIDVSTLGKLDVRGRDAGRLLDRVYTHVFSTLKVGRVRYGVLCGDDGIILDDGTVSRVDEDQFYITTTTGNIEFAEKWLKWWLAGTGRCAHVTNVTGDFAAVNLAGPRAREVLKKLTALDVSSNAFKYMDCARGEVAGVPALLMRIGFVGETGWEIHYPAGYGEYLWDTLLEAGKEFGIAPFGVEAQRLLRLEKKHVIVGQDTDALSNPLEADMEWVVKFDKEDFIGKPGLEAARARGLSNKLVGFVTETLVEEGSVIVAERKPVGRVTSARFSPIEKRCVGLAWVPLELAREGTAVEIQSNGSTVIARVHQQPFYDPEGARLKE
jgi:sarcosine oxidase subunit alpha